jgi:hypothetical protein
VELSIVTSASNGYGRYLPEWADSIAGLVTQPTMVAIAHTESERPFVERAVARLSGTRVLTREVPGDPNVGVLRNAAVALSDTEWVQHLDCDDLAMPHMLCDVAKLAPEADVVAMGYERTGDLAAGPKNLRRIYADTRGESTLKSTAPASGVSPFRRSFWERSPYRTDMIGGWDTALWLGFAHMNARFVATRRPCFWYRQHADSVFNTRRNNARLTNYTGSHLQSLRRGDRGVSVVVPFTGGDPARERAWAWVKSWYLRVFPQWEVIVGGTSGGWNKGRAVNAALKEARGDVVVIADADCVIDPIALRRAVRLAQTSPWVVPHRTVRRLSSQSTDEMLATGKIPSEPSLLRHPYEGYPGGGMFAIARWRLDAVGGYTEKFNGWGCEDEAMAAILDTLVGRHVRLDHDLWHLFHPPGRRTRSTSYHFNSQKLKAIRRLASDPDRLWTTITSRHQPRELAVW